MPLHEAGFFWEGLERFAATGGLCSHVLMAFQMLSGKLTAYLLVQDFLGESLEGSL